MYLQFNKNWFTLIELLVVITIIWLIIIWLSNINLNSQVHSKKLQILANEIKTSIESARNNSLLGQSFLSWWVLTKAENIYVDINLDTTTSAWTWIISIWYNNTNTWNTIELNKNEKLEIECFNIENQSIISNTNKARIDFIGNKIAISCWDKKASILQLKVENLNLPWISKTLRINKVSWVVESL